jgi:hypothetical protein
MGMFDAFMFDLSTIGLAQAECACNGIFLRGAITIGPWFRDPDRDIVVSTALADAYNMERTAVGEPVIGVHEDVFRLFEKTHGRKSYAKAADPFDSVLTTGRRKDGATIRFIHYLDSGLDGAASWNSDEDLKHYKAEHDEVKKRRIMSDSYTRNQKRFLLSHAQSIHNGLLAAPAVAKGKYEWLIDYHNKCVMDLGDQFSDCFIKSVT